MLERKKRFNKFMRNHEMIISDNTGEGVFIIRKSELPELNNIVFGDKKC